jgi:hypothetical protein
MFISTGSAPAAPLPACCGVNAVLGTRRTGTEPVPATLRTGWRTVARGASSWRMRGGTRRTRPVGQIRFGPVRWPDAASATVPRSIDPGRIHGPFPHARTLDTPGPLRRNS